MNDLICYFCGSKNEIKAGNVTVRVDKNTSCKQLFGTFNTKNHIESSSNVGFQNDMQFLSIIITCSALDSHSLERPHTHETR